jgi:putative endonuclease
MAVGRAYCVYVMTNAHHTVIYSGVTNDLARRVYEHKNGLGGTFTKKYNVVKLVYYEVTDNVYAALAREKQIKGGSRKKKIDLINSLNPEWKDLFDEII